jgi:uncharacterized protein YxjI
MDAQLPAHDASSPGAEAGQRFMVRAQLFAFGDDFYVENGNGERVCWIDGKALSIAKTLLFKDMQGDVKYRLEQKLLAARKTMTVYHADGSEAATIQKGLLRLLRDHFTIQVRGIGELETHGDLLHHEYTITQNQILVAQISQRWFRVQNTYGVQVTPGTLDPLLALALCIGTEVLQGVR